MRGLLVNVGAVALMGCAGFGSGVMLGAAWVAARGLVRMLTGGA